MQRHCVLIANTEFPDHSDLPTLATPLKDIEGLAGVLADRSRGGFNATPLANKSASEIATVLQTVVEATQPEDLLLIYYSGHGILDTQLRLSLATYDSTPKIDRRQCIRFDEIVERIARLRKVVILLDCCFSGAGGADLETKSGEVVHAARDAVRRYMTDSHRFADALEEKGSPSSLASEGDGIYLITACSSAEQAHGNLRSGYGVFTERIISGLKNDAAIEHPELSSKRVITARSLFRYLSEEPYDGSQTPMMFVRGATSSDLLLSEIELTGLSQPNPTKELRWHAILQNASLLPNLTPTYLLNSDYKFIDWNLSFEKLVASPLNLTRGSDVREFLRRLDNWREVEERSYEVFVPTQTPNVDIERFEFFSPKYRLIVFHKVASRIGNNSGDWCVTLNISYAQREEALWVDVRKAMNRETMWSRYAECYDRIIGEYPPYKELCQDVVSRVADAQRVLDLGAGTGNTTMLLLADPNRTVTAIELNDAMLDVCDMKVRSENGYRERTTLVKGDVVSCLRVEESESYDACVMLNVLFALEEPRDNSNGREASKKSKSKVAACLGEVYRVLRPGGVLALSTSRTTTDIHKLFGEIKSYLEESGEFGDKKEMFEQAYDRNKEMENLITQHTVEDIEGFVHDAGFQENMALRIPSAYHDCVLVMQAVKANS